MSAPECLSVKRGWLELLPSTSEFLKKNQFLFSEEKTGSKGPCVDEHHSLIFPYLHRMDVTLGTSYVGEFQVRAAL